MDQDWKTGAGLDSPTAIASFVLLGTIGVLSFIVQPALVQGFVTQLHLSEVGAVDLAGIEMAGVALATILLALVGARADWRVLTTLAILLAAAGNLASAFGLRSDWFAAARFVAGFGHGAIIGLSFTFVGLTRRTDRNLALYLISLLSYGAIGIWLAPTLFATIGLKGIFLFFAIATLASLATIRALPRSSSARADPSSSARQLSLPLLGTALAGVLVYNLAQGIAWANLFLIGIAAGLREQTVANALFVSQVTAVAGALAALFLAERMGRLLPIATGILGGALCIALLPGRPSAALFLISVCGFNILWNMVLPFILGAVSDMDLRGRMMSPAIAMQMVGLGLGPILSARLIGEGDFTMVEWFCVFCFGASFILLAIPLRSHRSVIVADTHAARICSAEKTHAN